eukprot:463525-Pyramimonas_sp.AAC.1
MDARCVNQCSLQRISALPDARTVDIGARTESETANMRSKVRFAIVAMVAVLAVGRLRLRHGLWKSGFAGAFVDRATARKSVFRG